MGDCNCGNKGGKPASFVVTTASGERKSYRTETEAATAAKRTGGTYRQSS